MKYFLILGALNLFSVLASAQASKVQCKLNDCKKCSLEIMLDQKQALYTTGKTSVVIPETQSFETRKVFQVEPNPSVPTLGYKLIYEADKNTASLYKFAGATKSKKMIYKNISCKN